MTQSHVFTCQRLLRVPRHSRIGPPPQRGRTRGPVLARTCMLVGSSAPKKVQAVRTSQLHIATVSDASG